MGSELDEEIEHSRTHVRMRRHPARNHRESPISPECAHTCCRIPSLDILASLGQESVDETLFVAEKSTLTTMAACGASEPDNRRMRRINPAPHSRSEYAASADQTSLPASTTMVPSRSAWNRRRKRVASRSSSPVPVSACATAGPGAAKRTCRRASQLRKSYKRAPVSPGYFASSAYIPRTAPHRKRASPAPPQYEGVRCTYTRDPSERGSPS